MFSLETLALILKVFFSSDYLRVMNPFLCVIIMTLCYRPLAGYGLPPIGGIS